MRRLDNTMTGRLTGLQGSPVFLISLCLPWLVLLGWLAVVAWFLCDDAFISFRYVRNLLEGHGLVFNPGEYVEGYTNFLWMLELAAIWRLLGIPPEQAVPWLSIACTVGTIAAMLWWVNAPAVGAPCRPALAASRTGLDGRANLRGAPRVRQPATTKVETLRVRSGRRGS